MASAPKPILLIDTREQKPYTFDRYKDQFARVESRKLLAGDYSLLTYETKLAVERKSLEDLVNTVIHGRERFREELRKLTFYDHASLVIEATAAQVNSPYSFSKANPASVIGSLQAFSVLYGVHVHFAGNRENAENWVAGLLLKFHKYTVLGERNENEG